MICWNCQTPLPSQEKKISFNASCEKCFSDLHVCRMCKFFDSQKPRECSNPEADLVSDKEKKNLCEEFFPTNTPLPKKKASPKDFNSLFKD